VSLLQFPKQRTSRPATTLARLGQEDLGARAFHARDTIVAKIEIGAHVLRLTGFQPFDWNSLCCDDS